METISTALERSVNYMMTIGIADIIDIVIVAYLLYKAIWFVRKTNSYNLAKGLAVLLIVLCLAALLIGAGVAGFLAYRKGIQTGVEQRKQQAEAAIGSAEKEAGRILDDAKKEGGSFRTVEGRVKKVDLYEGGLILTDGREIPFFRICQIDGVEEE